MPSNYHSRYKSRSVLEWKRHTKHSSNLLTSHKLRRLPPRFHKHLLARFCTDAKIHKPQTPSCAHIMYVRVRTRSGRLLWYFVKGPPRHTNSLFNCFVIFQGRRPTSVFVYKFTATMERHGLVRPPLHKINK